MLQGTDRNSRIQNLRAGNKAVPSLPLKNFNFTLKKEAVCDAIILIPIYQTCRRKLINCGPDYESKSNPITGLDRPRGFQEVEDYIFQDNPYMKVVRLSALHADRLYPPRKLPGTHFC